MLLLKHYILGNDCDLAEKTAQKAVNPFLYLIENEDKTMANISTTITIADKTDKITRFRGYITFCQGKVWL